MGNVRIENKGNVHHGGKKTSFKLFIFSDSANAFVFDGQYFAPGWNLTDEKCTAYADRCKIEAMDNSQGE